MSIIPFKGSKDKVVDCNEEAERARIQKDLEASYQALNGVIWLISAKLSREEVISVLEQGLRDFEEH
ncbi:MAG: hypothetical protein COA43_11265 [Robiginitomaculum sp.]|nr:MAG: hypothetical protein COA43_11265 [Robiginitomaculum sp.]